MRTFLRSRVLRKLWGHSWPNTFYFDGEDGLQRRSHRAWDYFAEVETQWDRQPGTGACPLLA
jgi:hypothetical protein